MRRIAVVHDMGAASVMEVAAALEGLAEPIFVCPDSAFGDQPRELMAELGRLCDIGGLDIVRAAAKVRAEQPDGIITFSEYQLERTGALAVELGLPFHSPDLVRKLTHKHVQREVLNGCGASAVPVRLVTGESSARRAVAEVGLPAVLKPDVGTGSRSTYRISSHDDLAAACRAEFSGPAAFGATEAFVLESELQGGVDTAPWGDYVSVESAVFDGAVTHLAITGKFPLEPPFRETGSFLPAAVRDEDEKDILDLVTRALTALGVRTGVCHTEVKFTPSGPQIIEVNGRLGGRVNALLSRAAGVDVVRLAARIALGDAEGMKEVTGIAYERIAFMYARVPPLQAQRVAEVQGLDRLRRLPGVSRVVLERGAGQSTDWRVGRLGHVYICFGATETHEALASLVDEMADVVKVRYE
ncbi:ATP-grasp domain-containing protein [Streptomyces griseomycini]|uniref:ATP-grasp domain-containing protein n=1 Tax=Streptomyces griseomycini TaxID=66895 RepID=UPI00343021F6